MRENPEESIKLFIKVKMYGFGQSADEVYQPISETAKIWAQ